MQDDNVLLEVKNLVKYFPVRRGIVIQRHVADVKAVDDISFFIRAGETLGMVGESGCGKTTAARTILQLYRPTSGVVNFEGVDLAQSKGKELRLVRRKMQMIFQDPYGSLNPRMNCGNIVGEPLIVHKITRSRSEYRDQVAELLTTVGSESLHGKQIPTRVQRWSAAAHWSGPGPGGKAQLHSL